MQSSRELILADKAVIAAAWLILLFVAERLWPAARARLKPGDTAWWRLVRNGCLWLLDTALSPLVVVPLTALASAHPLWQRPVWWSGWSGLLVDVVLLDFLVYWWHRANHEWPPLWRFHEIHHLDRFLDTTTALRFHFGEVLISALARAAVVVLLALPLASVLAFETILLMATIFHHSNLRLPARLEGGLARLIITPSIHWVHHHARRSDTDSNYGTVFSFWDRLFASASPTRRSPDMTIGVERETEHAVIELLRRPFRRRPAPGVPA